MQQGGPVKNLISIGLGCEAELEAAFLGDKVVMKKPQQDTRMLVEAIFMPLLISSQH